MKRIGILCIALLWSVASAISAEDPSAIVKIHIDKVVQVLNDPALADKPDAKIDKISKISESLFDYTELSKRSLGQNWKRFNPEQQKEFMVLYQKLLEKAYGNRILEYRNEKITFGKVNPLTEKTVEVPTSVKRQEGELAINYRLIEKNGQWMVYDVVIEGVSLVSNYRGQFREILANNPPEKLLEMLKRKVS